MAVLLCQPSFCASHPSERRYTRAYAAGLKTSFAFRVDQHGAGKGARRHDYRAYGKGLRKAVYNSVRREGEARERRCSLP